MLMSSLTLNGVNNFCDILSWYELQKIKCQTSIIKKNLEDLAGWEFTKEMNFSHESGKFFTIKGLNVEIVSQDFNLKWAQPIIHQPEIGVLGFIAKKFDGILHLLVQAKMEPGNINLVQISPTVQSTKSNYLQIHGGKKPKYIDWFLKCNQSVITIFDQLQSEQGSRYYKKRNRNMIVMVGDENFNEITDEFFWVTIGQLKKLHELHNVVHLDCRSIIGGIPLSNHDFTSGKFMITPRSKILKSLIGSERGGNSIIEVQSWLARLKSSVDVRSDLIPLKEVSEWEYSKGSIRHLHDRYFSIIGVSVSNTSREVSQWCQPLLKNVDGGILGLLSQLRMGVLHFLIQAKIEPGLIDNIELAPTLQFSPLNYEDGDSYKRPFFEHYFLNNQSGNYTVKTFLSDEGGRFYHSEQAHIVVELSPDEQIYVPPNYCWMTLNQIHQFSSFSSMVNIELRSLLSCLRFQE